MIIEFPGNRFLTPDVIVQIVEDTTIILQRNCHVDTSDDYRKVTFEFGIFIMEVRRKGRIGAVIGYDGSDPTATAFFDDPIWLTHNLVIALAAKVSAAHILEKYGYQDSPLEEEEDYDAS